MPEDRPRKLSLRKLGEAVNAERNRQGMSVQVLAKRAGCDEKSVRKVVKGEKTRDHIRFEICRALEIDATEATPKTISDDNHGGYTLDNVSEYIGHYIAHRRSQRFPKNIIRSIFVIGWSNERRCLSFEEHQRYYSLEMKADIDNSQSGDIFFSHEIGLFHLLTEFRGALRLITVSKFRLNNPDDMTMHGIILTQAKSHFQYQPFAAAIILSKAELLKGDAMKNGAGVIRESDHGYKQIDRDLAYVERHMATFATAPLPGSPVI